MDLPFRPWQAVQFAALYNAFPSGFSILFNMEFDEKSTKAINAKV
jgi:hypothetical protein